MSFWRNSTCKYPKNSSPTQSPRIWTLMFWLKYFAKIKKYIGWGPIPMAKPISRFCGTLSNANFRNPSPPSHPSLGGDFFVEALKTAAPGHVSWDPPGRPKRTSTLLGPGCPSPGSGWINLLVTGLVITYQRSILGWDHPLIRSPLIHPLPTGHPSPSSGVVFFTKKSMGRIYAYAPWWL